MRTAWQPSKERQHGKFGHTVTWETGRGVGEGRGVEEEEEGKGKEK